MKSRASHMKRLALMIVFSALGVATSPYTWFYIYGTKANPIQHMINAILGVLAGPLWAAAAAVFIGAIRNMLGVGTIYAFPGGIPGGLVVGSVYWLLKRLKISESKRLVAALTEPVGTVLIGAPLALFLVAPWIGDQKTLSLISSQGLLSAFLTFGFGWALSCIPGSTIGFSILLILRKIGISRDALFGEQ